MNNDNTINPYNVCNVCQYSAPNAKSMYVHVQKKRCISLADEVDTSIESSHVTPIDGFSSEDIDMIDSADTPGNDDDVDEGMGERIFK